MWMSANVLCCEISLMSADFHSRWASKLTERSFKVSTIVSYSKRVKHFVTYLSEAPPVQCRLSKNQIFRILRTLKSCVTEVSKSLPTYQVELRASKAGKTLD